MRVGLADARSHPEAVHTHEIFLFLAKARLRASPRKGARRIPHDHGIVGHIADNHRSHSDQGTGADSDTRPQRAGAANESTGTDRYIAQNGDKGRDCCKIMNHRMMIHD